MHHNLQESLQWHRVYNSHTIRLTMTVTNTVVQVQRIMQSLVCETSVLHDINDMSTFRKRLENALYDCAYNRLLLALLDVSYRGALQISR